jgi:hypothetical protein
MLIIQDKRSRYKVPVLIAVTILLAAAFASLVYRWASPHAEERAQQSAPPVVASTTRTAEPPPGAVGPTQTTLLPPAASGSAPAVASLSAKVKELAASKDPKDAFSAYWILQQCRHANRSEREHQLTRQADRSPDYEGRVSVGAAGPAFVVRDCGDLQDADFKNMLTLVERAAEAGVPMAALYYAEEGPWGDVDAVRSRWNDPLVQEWRAKVIRLWHLAASKGDVSALDALQSQYETGEGLIAERNAGLALRYAVAKQIVHEAITGREMPYSKKELSKMTAAVTPEVAARETAAGQTLAREALAGRSQN